MRRATLLLLVLLAAPPLLRAAAVEAGSRGQDGTWVKEGSELPEEPQGEEETQVEGGAAGEEGMRGEEETSEKEGSMQVTEEGLRADEEAEPAAEGRVLYTGAQLLRVFPQTEEQRKVLDDLIAAGEVRVWRVEWSNASAGAGAEEGWDAEEGAGADVLAEGDRVAAVTAALQAAGIRTRVLIEDLQDAIDAENTLVSEEQLDELQGRYGHRMEWQSYHRLQDIHQFQDYMAATYKDLCSVQTIGTSEGGRPLKVLKIQGDQPGGPIIWVDGGMHAREWVSPASVAYLANELALNRESLGAGAQAATWLLLPVANPDGYEHSHTRDRLWRKNRRAPPSNAPRCAGVDLNRNYGYKWGGQGASRRPCDEIYAGSGPFSEPETSAIQRFLSSTPGLKASLSFHSYGQYVLYPWGYARTVPPDHAELRRVGDKMASAMRRAGGASYRVGPAGATLYPAAGGSDDWAKGSLGLKYAYTVELRDQGTYGFVLPAHLIEPTAKEAVAAARVLADEVAGVGRDGEAAQSAAADAVPAEDQPFEQ